MEHEILTVKELAAYLRISPSNAYKLVRAGSIPHVKIGSRYVIPTASLLLWLESHSFGGASRA